MQPDNVHSVPTNKSSYKWLLVGPTLKAVRQIISIAEKEEIPWVHDDKTCRLNKLLAEKKISEAEYNKQMNEE